MENLLHFCSQDREAGVKFNLKPETDYNMKTAIAKLLALRRYKLSWQCPHVPIFRSKPLT